MAGVCGGAGTGPGARGIALVPCRAAARALTVARCLAAWMLLHPAGAAGQAPEPMDIAGAAAATPDNAGSDPDGPATGAPRVLRIASS